MGTRGLVILKRKKQGKEDVCRIFNQFDSYPSFLGEFLIKSLKKEYDLEYNDSWYKSECMDKMKSNIIKNKLEEMKYNEIISNVTLKHCTNFDMKNLDLKENYFSKMYNMVLSFENVQKHIVIKDELEEEISHVEWTYTIDFENETFSIKGGYYEPTYNITELVNDTNWLEKFDTENDKLAKLKESKE